ncbi:flagellar protein export ATPase FliI [Salinibacillus xinjiangensis]|uniref:Flagellar protein export ATPase FliI n=1 Tax=Salinibacillus xinjiangensis TaxID=1229268 RepID=A0A6G1X3E3_9BACI|nr:flagellar protein export ATPase FliI [Salinibacillus xinjiangensis]MRG85400.1 flagellar protein export ATPase FliI [Salinibacillus xinjiangensis]
MKASLVLDWLEKIDTVKSYGKVTKIVGIMIEATGPDASIGDVCYVYTKNKHQQPIMAEVVGFQKDSVLLMPYAQVKNIGPGCLVEATQQPLMVQAGRSMIGSILDGLGNQLNQSSLPKGLSTIATDQDPPNPMERPPIKERISIGVKAIDGLLTIGKGQRVGIFAGSGVGKSTLLGMIARNSDADLNVIALIGERGREVREFIENDLGEEGLKKSIVVVATSDQPPLQRIKGAYTATAICEYFRDQGYHVNLMMDSVTRVAMAQREVGLATGEPPTTKGYTPSVFATLPKLLERTGTNVHGTITAFYTVLVDGDDLNEPIADTVRGILDGHLVLDRSIAEQGRYPAINILKSISRVMNQVAKKDHIQAAAFIRNLLAVYEENKELIQIGAYKKGTSREVDEAISFYPRIIGYLKQSMDESFPGDEGIQVLLDIANGSET